jgi:hypothetical protein
LVLFLYGCYPTKTCHTGQKEKNYPNNKIKHIHKEKIKLVYFDKPLKELLK